MRPHKWTSLSRPRIFKQSFLPKFVSNAFNLPRISIWKYMDPLNAFFPGHYTRPRCTGDLAWCSARLKLLLDRQFRVNHLSVTKFFAASPNCWCDHLLSHCGINGMSWHGSEHELQSTYTKQDRSAMHYPDWQANVNPKLIVGNRGLRTCEFCIWFKA